jgi:hypothetical protein
MAIQKTRNDFFQTEEGKIIKDKLLRMAEDGLYNTSSSFSANSDTYPDNLIPFVDKHMNYLMTHPNIEADKYLANIKLITRIRG